MSTHTTGQQGGDLRGRGPIQLDLSTCVNPYGPPDAVLATLRDMPESAVRLHPYAAAGDVESAYAEHLGQPASQFTAGQGSSNLIWLLARQFDGKATGLPLPGYTEFRRAFPRARLFGGGPSTHPAEILDEAMTACDMVMISNPHNPTGQVIPQRDLADVAARHPASTLVVDESYMDFLPDETAVTLVGCGADNVIVLRSPSKFWGLAGVRSGAAWSRQPLRALWDSWRTSWPVSAFAAAALRTALADRQWASGIRQVLARDAKWLEDCITPTGLHIAPGRLHFRLVTGPAPDVSRLAGGLGSCGIAVRVLEAAYGVGRPAMRISAPRRQDRQQLAAALDSYRHET